MPDRPAFGVALGTVGIDAREWLRLADRLALLPIERVWIWDHLLGRGAAPRPALEVGALASAALARSETLHVGTLVLDVTKRHPAVVAAWAATVASLAPGRIALGFGAGGDASEHAVRGIPFPSAPDRIAALDSAMRTVRALLEHDAATLRPTPPIELLVAGDRRESIEIAAREADAWVAPAATFAAGVALLHSAAAHTRRSGHSVRPVVLQELARGERFAETPVAVDPVGWWSARRGEGAQGAILTVRTEADIEALTPLLGVLR